MSIIIFEGEHVSRGFLRFYYDRVITVNGFKSYAMTGGRIGILGLPNGS